MNKILILRTDTPVPGWLDRALLSDGLMPEMLRQCDTALVILDSARPSPLAVPGALDLPHIVLTRVDTLANGDAAANDGEFGKAESVAGPVRTNRRSRRTRPAVQLAFSGEFLTVEYEV